MGSPNPHRNPENLRVDSLSETPDPVDYLKDQGRRLKQQFLRLRGH